MTKRADSDYTNTTFYKNAEAFAKNWKYEITSLTIQKIMTSRLWNNQEMVFGSLTAYSDYCD